MKKTLLRELVLIADRSPPGSLARRIVSFEPISLSAPRKGPPGLAERMHGTPASKALGRLVMAADAATKALPSQGSINDLMDAVIAASRRASNEERGTLEAFGEKVEEAESTLEKAKGAVTLLWKQVNELTAMWPGLPPDVIGRD